MWPYRNVGFPAYNLHRATNSPWSSNKIRLAFHFVEPNKSGYKCVEMDVDLGMPSTVHGNIYVTKEDSGFIQSFGHPDQTNYHPPRTTFHAQIPQEKQN